MTQATKPAFDREYRTVDKSGWRRGPWDAEPDKAQWIDPATGLDCLLVRNGGALCGYVGLPPEHPWHGEDYCNVPVDVHGGLTFAAACADTDDESRHICHVPQPGRPHDVWWFGFDCAHGGDLDPRPERYDFDFDWPSEYRDVAYVQSECVRLAKQLAAVSS